LRTTATDDRALSIRLEAARNIYNACLVEALRRRDHTAASLQAYAQQCRDACWIKDHLGGHDTQTTSLRAFRAVEQHMLGKRGRPRLATEFNTIEGKEARSTIVFRDEVIIYAGLVLPTVINDEWQREALEAKTKYCRIVRRRIRGRVRWYVQLVQAGAPPMRRVVGKDVVGLDIGPSTIAAVGSEEAIFEQFCPTVTQPWAEQRRVARAMARKVPGSIQYRALALELHELERRLAAERKRCHGELVNRILGCGVTIKTERLSYRSWQRRYGRSTKVRGAGMFMRILRRKADTLIEFEPRHTCLSQVDHVSGVRVRKPLSQRYHEFADGSRVDRDVYSAWLARFVEGGVLDLDAARAAWPMPVTGRGFALPSRVITSQVL
jgi:hypothetical protein